MQSRTTVHAERRRRRPFDTLLRGTQERCIEVREIGFLGTAGAQTPRYTAFGGTRGERVFKGIGEQDWAHLAKLKPLALERLCQRILSEVQREASDASKSQHERYLAVYRIIQEGDADIAGAFNDLTRGSAWLRLLAMRRLSLLTDPECEGFSDETRRMLSEVARAGGRA